MFFSPQTLHPVATVTDLRRSHALGGTRIEALRGVSLTLARGTVTVIRGASGSGKSTLFTILAGLTRPDAGTVEVFGIDLARLSDTERARLRRRRIALIFQAYNLFPNLTALENVAFPLMRGGAAEARSRAAEALARLGLSHRAAARPRVMSGGEQQRVAVARALAGGPELMLADEPTGALDPDNAAAVMDALRGDARARGSSVFMISHDPAASARADAVYEMREGLLHAL